MILFSQMFEKQVQILIYSPSSYILNYLVVTDVQLDWLF